jgi:hypothetical protein
MKTFKVVLLCAVVAGLWLGMSASAALGREAVKVGDPTDEAILNAFLKHAERAALMLTKGTAATYAADKVEQITWELTPQLDMALTAYELTGNTKFLDIYLEAMDNLRSALTKGPNDLLDWYGKLSANLVHPERPDQKLPHDLAALVVSGQIAQFVELTDEKPELKKKYEKQRAELLDLAENHLLKQWQPHFIDLGRNGGIHRHHPDLVPHRARMTYSHSKQGRVVQTMLAMYRATGKDEYMQTAVKLGTRFKRCLTLRDGRYVWNHWDPAGQWDVHPTDAAKWKHWMGTESGGGDYAGSVAMAVALYHHGVVFTRDDIERFLKTQTELVWNGSADSPQWFRFDVARVSEQSYMAASLAPLNEKVAQYCFAGQRQNERQEHANHGWRGGPLAVGYLRGKYLTQEAARDGKQIHASFGEKFRQKEENRKLLESLEFRVTDTGYSAPLTPRAMRDMPQEPGGN